MANIRPLPPDLQKIAIEELNEVPERVADDIEALKIWIEQQPHLRARTDDQFLLGFLRGCKFSLEKAKSKIDKYYMLQTKFPELFAYHDVDDPKFREALRLGVALMLPMRLNGDGPRLCIYRNGIQPADKDTFYNVSRVSQALNEIFLIEDDHLIVKGVVVIIDMQSFTTQHAFLMTPGLMKKMTVYSEEALPMRPKAMHMVNTPAILDPFWNTIKPLMPKKQLERMFLHGAKIEKLYEYVPQKYLPKEYGGENGSIPELIDYWEQKVLSYREYFQDSLKYGTDEALRPGKPIDFECMFGMEGSFRKLNVD